MGVGDPLKKGGFSLGETTKKEAEKNGGSGRRVRGPVPYYWKLVLAKNKFR